MFIAIASFDRDIGRETGSVVRPEELFEKKVKFHVTWKLPYGNMEFPDSYRMKTC